MDFVTKIVSSVGGEQAVNLINENLTPLLLNSFRPKISDYVGNHVERSREELFRQLPDGVHKVLDDLIPSNNQRGIVDDIFGSIKEKLSEIMEEIKLKVRDIVQNVTASTSDRVTDGVVTIAKQKLKLDSQRTLQEGNSSRDVGEAVINRDGQQGDFIDRFVNNSLTEVRPLVKSELKAIYDHLITMVPADARKILCAIVPGLDDDQPSQNQSQNFNQGSNQQNYDQNQNVDQSRGIEEEGETSSRGLFSDLKNMAHEAKQQFTAQVASQGLGNSGGTNTRDLLDEFQSKARSKVDVIATQVLTSLEELIMATVSKELSDVARNKLAKIM